MRIKVGFEKNLGEIRFFGFKDFRTRDNSKGFLE